ncbi:hypothetical protein QLQ12_37240 [Actinoplanes sp. NEAU-A12]|uniref:DUF7802 domain-containing protein n=1 Tax=Actinoplanes sandaracinus TaxID=3045177 RepID=A0ABT6WWY4_9ACTN|nr:hypothetical protein [Actinoplanes sandaracinus]MDI6104252.1 hypothetical protein [Actinoplanes sandaracinus]
MSAVGPCHADFTALAGTLGGIDCATANPVVTVRDPGTLQSWTQPVLELLMVVGAVVALVHAVLWWRRRGDLSNLGLWLATVVYVLLLEPPLYFPDRFGLDEPVGLIFVHNVFTVQFLFDRLPLYIVALYPAMTYLAYTIVQRTGILDRRHPLIGAACVAVVFHAGYEIFDQLGPGLRWWTWNPAAPSNAPMLGDAPLTSAVIFAAAAPFGTALLTRLLLARRPLPGWSFAWRTAAVGILTPLAMMVFSAPTAPFGATGRAAVLWAELAALTLVAAAAFRHHFRRQPRLEAARGGADRFLDRGPLYGGVAYLAVFALLWTAGNAPPPAVAYAIVCALVFGAAVVARPRPPAGPPSARTSLTARLSAGGNRPIGRGRPSRGR